MEGIGYGGLGALAYIRTRIRSWTVGVVFGGDRCVIVIDTRKFWNCGFATIAQPRRYWWLVMEHRSLVLLPSSLSFQFVFQSRIGAQ